MMNKFLLPAFALVLCLTLAISPARAQGEGDPVRLSAPLVLTAEEKADFAQEAAQRYTPSAPSTQNTEGAPYDLDLVYEWMMEAAFAADETEKATYLGALEGLGIYRFPAGTAPAPASQSQSADVCVNRCDVYYSVPEDVWVVAISGRWLNDGWRDETELFSRDIGGREAFGIAFSDVSNYDALVVRSAGILCSSVAWDGHLSNTTCNRSWGDTTGSFGFELQDYTQYIAIPNEGITEHTYIGSQWFGANTYSSEFTHCSGTATGYYVHTGRDAYISDISFGVGGNQAGLSVTIGQNTDFWPIELIQNLKPYQFLLIVLGCAALWGLLRHHRNSRG